MTNTEVSFHANVREQHVHYQMGKAELRPGERWEPFQKRTVGLLGDLWLKLCSPDFIFLEMERAWEASWAPGPTLWPRVPRRTRPALLRLAVLVWACGMLWRWVVLISLYLKGSECSKVHLMLKRACSRASNGNGMFARVFLNELSPWLFSLWLVAMYKQPSKTETCQLTGKVSLKLLLVPKSLPLNWQRTSSLIRV